MPKRKRSIALTEENNEVDKKKKKIHLDLNEICHELYDIIRTHKASDGHLVSESFIRAPKRRSSGDYYDVISNPIDLARIQQKIKADDYETIDQFASDVELMINNAKSYYKKTTAEYKDACELWEVFTDGRKELEGNDDEEEESPYEELFSTIMTSLDTDGRNMSLMFKLLPSKENYPEYYSVIKDPIDLKMIAKKIVDNSYQSLTDMDKDLLLMVKNAKAFNEPGSQIYKDATALRKIIQVKKSEIDQRKSLPSKSSERIKAKKNGAVQKWSVIVANASEEEEEEESTESNKDADSDHGEDMQDDTDVGDESNSPLWVLYNTVKKYQWPHGNSPLSDPFLRLPNKRFHMDYYKEIQNPVSLLKIKQKINTKYYSSPMELVDDLNLMFENAKKYNRTESKIFKDAVKLQKVMQAKARELINITLKDSESEDESGAKSRKSRKLSSPVQSPPEPRIERRGRKPLHQTQEDYLKKKLRILYKALLDHTNESGRNLISMFMEKPSKKDYPDYYEVIANPIDMKMIDHNIKADKYTSEEQLITDFKLMFSNCQQYNEERSLIYKDAILLEQVLMDKVKEFQQEPNKHRNFLIKRSRLAVGSYLKPKLKNFYERIRDYTDSRGRKLSTIFMKLPSKAEYPEYYEVIKRPINMEKIFQKMKSSQYDGLEDMMADFILMFDNACRYNEPDSQIYKDALNLQRVVLQTKNEFCQNLDFGHPDIRSLIQELLTNLFISVYNHQDEEGRSYSDSVVELSEAELMGDQAERQPKPLTLDQIKCNLDKARYRRLDRFQEHMFEVFENARSRSRTDSQVFEDSIELQTYFIQVRDEVCQYGKVLSSPAFAYTQADLQASIDALKAEKLPKEQQEAEQDIKSEKEDKNIEDGDSSESMNFKGQTYSTGDFVYVEPREKGMEPHIINIERMWKDKHDEDMIFGTWFYRPNETFHLATRKFLEKEVFRSDNRTSTPLNQVIGKCYVMWIKDYFKTQPEGFNEKDVFVCESRYSAKLKAFKTIKLWPYTASSDVELVTRATPLTPIRVPSLFKNGGVEGKSKDGGNNLDDNDTSVIDKPRPNVILDNVPSSEEGSTYYEQFTIPAGTFKLGDSCYVRTENGKTLIGRIDKIWVKGGNPFFHGPWFVTPQEVQHSPNRLFYKQEVFLSSIQDTNPLLSVKARCAVLDMKDYVIRRPTEIEDQDIYVCESRYMEAERQIRKLSKGLKKFSLSDDSTEDEFYTFKKPINLEKEMSPLMVRAGFETDNDESSELPPLNSDFSTPHSSRKKPSNTKRLVSGYILFASEIRKKFNVSYPDRTFGEVSRLIGNEWRCLLANQKAEYEERAQKQNEEMTALMKEGLDSYPQSPASGENSRTGSERGENVIYECSWDKCDYQFEDMPDLSDHLLADSTGHLYQTFPNPKAEGEYQCYWANCMRIKKNIPPFPNIQRLTRHLREVHLKTACKSVLPENRSRNFTPSQRRVASPAVLNTPIPSGPHFTSLHTPHSPHPGMYPPLPSSFAPSPHPMYTLASPGGYMAPQGPIMSPRIPDPVFVSAPPRTQRLLHSTTYVKYIEGLQIENKHISNWDGQLKATKHNTMLADARRMPTHWLANGPGNHGTAVNALWALRDFMLKDALNVSKIL